MKDVNLSCFEVSQDNGSLFLISNMIKHIFPDQKNSLFMRKLNTASTKTKSPQTEGVLCHKHQSCDIEFTWHSFIAAFNIISTSYFSVDLTLPVAQSKKK